MKLLKRILATTLAIALVAFVPGFNASKAKAEGAVTYTVKYVAELSEWRVQKLAKWDDTRENGAMSFLYGNVKDGDSVVVLGGSDSPSFGELKIDVKLANLTLYQLTNGIMAYANKGITEIYVLKGSQASLHGIYDNVYVFDNSAANINNDVKYVRASKESSMEMNITAVGTVDRCQIDDNGNVIKTMYNVKANSLRIVKGVDKTDTNAYSTTPGAQPTTTTTTTTPASQGTVTGTVSPKTGETGYAFLLLAGAVLCFAGAYYSKKKLA